MRVRVLPGAPRIVTSGQWPAVREVAEWQRQTGTVAELIPEDPTLDRLRFAAADCKACDLWARATRTVFGEGQEPASVMLVGEQPGDAEDVEGKPFVGPAGKLLDRALEEAGIDRRQAYVTNAVKHFNWSETRGKKRIPKKPNARQMAACKPWLEAEIQLLRPTVIVLLGATAAQQLLGPGFSIIRQQHLRLSRAKDPASAAQWAWACR